MSDVNNLSHNEEHLNVSKVYQHGSIKNNIYSRIFQLIEFLSCFSTMMSTLHDGPLVRQELAKFWTIQGGNSGLPIYLVISLG